MLRRKPTRVEDRADVADEYATYAREKQQQQREGDASFGSQRLSQGVSLSQSQSDAQRHSQQVRQQTRARIGMGMGGAFATQ